MTKLIEQEDVAIRMAIACTPGDDEDADDEPYDDSKDHDPCPDCAHTSDPGWYVGLNGREHCKTCDGSVWV